MDGCVVVLMLLWPRIFGLAGAYAGFGGLASFVAFDMVVFIVSGGVLWG